MDELLDVLDEQMNRIGTAPRSQVHEAGWWHQTFHCWLCDSIAGEDMLLLQRRHPSKDTNPGKWDVSCAGHLAAGELPEDGVRELQEELGVAIAPSQLVKLGLARHHFRKNGVIDNEFSHVFVLRCGYVHDVHRFQVAADEVSGLYRIAVHSFKELVDGKSQSAVLDGAQWTDEGWMHHVCEVQMVDLVHREPDYYRLLWQYFHVL
ncbi:hypothetical protein SD51_05090 [Alicyclobacillus tengchongensis]|nr:hypothetical protein SD51_05090 [Alicyclobacillus tengchongensis]